MVYVNKIWKVQHKYHHQPLTVLFPDTGKYFQYALKKNYGGDWKSIDTNKWK